MRRLAAALALLAAAACTVPLEGAPCSTDANCPDSQRCDTATRACVTCEADPACTADGFTCVGGNTLKECRTNAGSCRYSSNVPCGTLTCSSGACTCPTNGGSEFVADAVQGSGVGAPFFPSGISSPPQCRFRRLGDALAAAGVYVAGVPGRTAEVRAAGRSGGIMVFSGEQFPLTVTPGVTLTTDDTLPVAGGYVVDLDNAIPVTAAIRVQEDAALVGFLVRPSAAGGANVGVAVACAAAGAAPAQVSAVTVDGKGALASAAVARGIEVTGICSADLADVRVQSVSGAGVYLASTGTASGTPALSLLRTTVTAAGDTGIQVRLDATPPLQPSLSIVSSEVGGNTGTQTYGTPGRRAGGVLLWGLPPSSLTFHSNRIHDNGGDQVVVFSSYAWNLTGGGAMGDCDVTSNTLACYDTGGVGLALASNGSVDARFNSWAHNPPSAAVDFWVATGGTVDTVGGGGDVCAAVPPSSCPLPAP